MLECYWDWLEGYVMRKIFNMLPGPVNHSSRAFFVEYGNHILLLLLVGFVIIYLAHVLLRVPTVVGVVAVMLALC